MEHHENPCDINGYSAGRKLRTLITILKRVLSVAEYCQRVEGEDRTECLTALERLEKQHKEAESRGPEVRSPSLATLVHA